MPVPRWMLFSPLVIVMVAGLTARCHPHPPRRPKTGGGKSASAPDFAVQPARPLGALPGADAAPTRTRPTQDTLYGPPAPVPGTRPLAGEDALLASLAVSGEMGGRGWRDGDARSAAERNGDGETWPDVGDAKQDRRRRSGKNSRGAEDESYAAGEGGRRYSPPHYAAWTPAPIYGPPCPPERMRVRRQAHRLLQDLEAGRLEVMMSERDGEQLRCLERDGVYGWPAPPQGVAVRSPRQRDILEGTLEASEMSFVSPDPSQKLSQNERGYARNSTPSGAHADLTLASRGSLPRRSLALNPGSSANSTINPADDPDFDPCVLPPAPGLLRMLTTLAAHSTPARPLCVMSLLRPPYRMGGFVHVGPANPHSLGLAVDIAAYGGYGIRQSNPEQCVAATLALLRDLPPGRYRMGMPKAPEGGWEPPPALSALLRRAEAGLPVAFGPSSGISSDAESEASASGSKGIGSKKNDSKSAIGAERLSAASPSSDLLAYAGRSSGTKTEQAQAAAEQTGEATGCATAALYGLHASRAKPAWPFFPPPYLATPESLTPENTNAPAVQTSLVFSSKPVLRFQNEAYAPEDGLMDARLRRALQRARQRGVDVIALFPDGADHIHVDVRQNP